MATKLLTNSYKKIATWLNVKLASVKELEERFHTRPKNKSSFHQQARTESMQTSKPSAPSSPKPR